MRRGHLRVGRTARYHVLGPGEGPAHLPGDLKPDPARERFRGSDLILVHGERDRHRDAERERAETARRLRTRR